MRPYSLDDVDEDADDDEGFYEDDEGDDDEDDEDDEDEDEETWQVSDSIQFSPLAGPHPRSCSLGAAASPRFLPAGHANAHEPRVGAPAGHPNAHKPRVGAPAPRSGPWRTAKVRRLLDIGQRTA